MIPSLQHLSILLATLGPLALLACGGASNATFTRETPVAPDVSDSSAAPPIEPARPLLSEPWTEWTANPAYSSVDLPFVMGITARPCDAEYSVQGYPRIDVTYTYDAHRIVVAVTPGEMSGQGHSFCLPNPPFLWALGLDPLTLTWELDERGRVVGQTIEETGEVRSRTRFLWEDERWVGVAYGDAEAQPIAWGYRNIESVPRTEGAVLSFAFEGEGRLVDRRTEAANGALNISQYSYETHSARLVGWSFEFYPDPEADPSIRRGGTFDYDDDGRPLRCSTSDGGEPLTVRYEYDPAGRLVARRALVVDEYEGEVHEEEAWAWSYRYDCSAPRPSNE